MLLGEKINSDVSISALSQLLCKHDKMLKAKQSETDKKGGGWGWGGGGTGGWKRKCVYSLAFLRAFQMIYYSWCELLGSEYSNQ